MSTKGKVVVHRLSSVVLKGNPLGDPTDRDLHVYLPPDYDGLKVLPALLAVVGFTSTGGALFNLDPFTEDLGHRADRLIVGGSCPPVIVVAPDCFTRVGGNQYINSTATGRYEDYLLEEVIPFVKKTYRTGPWGIFGKSSGGYGSIVLAMRHPEVFEAVASHSGDAGFELCYLPEFADALDAWHDAGGPAQWLDRFWADPNKKRKKHSRPLNMLAMSAHYSPNPCSPHLGIDFPFDLETGVFLPEVWERWRAWDPVNMVPKHVRELMSLRLIYVDCGKQDEYGLHWGARALVKAMRREGLSPRYEEFDDGHMNVAYRYDVSVPALAKALQ
jgi:S-formylglutathione hydrolase FrmB